MAGNIYPHVNKLWLFSLVAAHESFKRAAAEASLTPSALSQGITALEQHLGKTLLVRNRTRIELTDAGREILERALPILHALDEMFDVEATAARPRTLRLGLYETIASNHLPHLFPKLQRAFPRLTLQIRTGRSALLDALLRDGELDAVVVVRDPDIEDSAADFLAKGELGFFVGPDGPVAWADAAHLSMATLSSARSGHGAYYQRFLDTQTRLLRARHITCPIVVRSDSIETLAKLAAVGGLVALLPLRAGLRNGLKRLPELSAGGKGTHHMCLVTRPSLDPRVRQVLRHELTRLLKDVP
jgi:LysR family hydrogen peroxide-inducible transcriptional activator